VSEAPFDVVIQKELERLLSGSAPQSYAEAPGVRRVRPLIGLPGEVCLTQEKDCRVNPFVGCRVMLIECTRRCAIFEARALPSRAPALPLAAARRTRYICVYAARRRRNRHPLAAFVQLKRWPTASCFY
jgi:hypothetical protein